ncbi:MAG TPA: TetR/AcrR family transcriptional regulator [Acidimicrobiales bacterium]|nr:TetR/AcrR family transcriptional regulator [Acidimicrobiales bacterium]
MEQILAAAWELARRDGLGGVSLRELADRVDLRQPSLYSYFPSKAELYDAMFAQGFQELVEERERLVLDPDPTAALRQGCRHFIEFCTRDPVRYQLLFQHSIPQFSPSERSMQISRRALTILEGWLVRAGVTDPAGLDLMRAMLLGVAGEQIANEPGGQRWVQYTDDLVDVVVEVLRRRRSGPPARSRASRKGTTNA